MTDRRRITPCAPKSAPSVTQLTTAQEQAKATLCAVGLLFSLCVAGFVFVLFFVPETRGRSLEAVRQFRKREPGPRGQAA